MNNTMNRRILRVTAVTIIVAAVVLTTGRAADVRMAQVGRSDLCVTEGAIEERHGKLLSVDVPKMRAYVNHRTPQMVEARFTYLGATGKEARLGSGEMRRQFGLKLRSQDACNLVYAMWRIAPESRLVVSVKTNPGQHTSAECTNHGYRNVKPLRSVPLPLLRPGDTHLLRAEMNGDQVRVFVDNAVVWDGTLGPDALSFDGPVGIRSDNARLEMELQAGEFSGTHPRSEIGCKSGPSESE